MAVSTSSYFSNSIVGVPFVGNDVDVSEVHSSPKYPIGQRYERQDGSTFRYAHFGVATSAGTVVSADVSESSYPYTANAGLAPASTYQMPDEQNGVYPGSIGSKYICLALGTVTENQFRGGYLTIAGGTGKGYTYRINSNTANGTPITSYTRLRLSDPIQATIASATHVIVAGNKYANLEAATAADPVVAGVTVANVNTAGYWGWLKTRGPIGALTDSTSASTLAIGSVVTISTATAGAVADLGSFTSAHVANVGVVPFIGTVATIGEADDLAIINLTIE